MLGGSQAGAWEPGTVEDGSVDLPGSVKQNHLPRPRAPLDAPRDSACPAGNVRILTGTHSHHDVVRGSCDAQTIQDRIARLSGQRGYALSGVNRQPYARLECGGQAVACRLIQIAGSQGLGDGGAKEEHAGSKQSDSRCCEIMTHSLEGLAVVGHVGNNRIDSTRCFNPAGTQDTGLCNSLRGHRRVRLQLAAQGIVGRNQSDLRAHKRCVRDQ